MEFNKSWNEYILYDLANWKNGLAFKDINFSNKGKPIIKIAELKNGITEQTKYTDGDYGEEVYLSKNDLIFSWSGNPKTSIDAFLYDLPEGYLNQHSFKITEKKEIVAKYFLYYVLKYLNPVFQSIASDKQTTGLGHVTITDLKKIKVRIPDLDVQYKILDIVKNIDDKIYNNNQINDNLLNLLRASFKKYFIENLKKDWKEQKLENIVSIRRGASPRPIQKFLSSEGINWLKISDVTGIDSPFIYDIKEKIIEEGKSKSLFINKGTLVVSNSATPGIPKFIMIDTCVHDGWLVLSNFDYKYKNYLYFLIEQIRENLIKLANGSVFNNLKTDILKEYKFYNPDDDTLEKFNSIAEAMMNKINKNTTENKHLESIRDTLLPKLMNGEIDLDKIEI